jgi:thioredoxin
MIRDGRCYPSVFSISRGLFAKEEGMAEHLNADSFKEKVFDYEKSKEWDYNGDLPAIVDFYADWCGPCKMIAPILEEISEEYKGKLHVYKINTEEEPELSGAFGIQSIPSLLFIPMEGKPQMSAGALPKDSLVQIIQDVLAVK